MFYATLEADLLSNILLENNAGWPTGLRCEEAAG